MADMMRDQFFQRSGADTSKPPQFSLKALLYSSAVLPLGSYICFRLFPSFMYALSHPGSLTFGWLTGCMMIGSGLFAFYGKPLKGALLALVIQIPLYIIGLLLLAFSSPHIIG